MAALPTPPVPITIASYMSLDGELDRRLADFFALRVSHGELQRVGPVVDPLGDPDEVGDEEIAAWVGAIVFARWKFLFGDALAAAVEDLVAAFDRCVTAL